MITPEDVEHIAKLARIKITQREKEKLVQELGFIFGYIEKLNQVDTSEIEPTAQVTGLENVFREDIPVSFGNDIADKLLKSAPDRDGRYLKVKSVFNK